MVNLCFDMSILSFFDAQRRYKYEGKGISSCNYPIGAVEKGTADIEYVRNCDGHIVNVVVNQIYIRNQEQEIHSSFSFMIPTCKVFYTQSLGSCFETEYRVEKRNHTIRLTYESTSYSAYLGKMVLRRTISEKTPTGWNWKVYFFDEESQSFVMYFQGTFTQTNLDC